MRVLEKKKGDAKCPPPSLFRVKESEGDVGWKEWEKEVRREGGG